MLIAAHAHSLSSLFTSQPGGAAISHSDMNEITSRFVAEPFKNNEEFIAQNTLSQTIGIIYSGIFKAESTYANGEKKIRALFFEGYNRVVVDCCSFGNGVVSKQSTFSRGESTLLIISESDFNYLSRIIPAFGIIGRNMLTQSCEAHKQLRMDYELPGPLQKRQKFDASFPHLINELTREEKAFLTGAGKNIF